MHLYTFLAYFESKVSMKLHRLKSPEENNMHLQATGRTHYEQEMLKELSELSILLFEKSSRSNLTEHDSLYQVNEGYENSVF